MDDICQYSNGLNGHYVNLQTSNDYSESRDYKKVPFLKRFYRLYTDKEQLYSH